MRIYNINEMPMGISYEQWCIKWWQWLLTIPRFKSPAYDISGQLALEGQRNAEVVFLCQTIETTEPIPERRISIPANKSVFMPIINWISVNDYDEQPDDYLIALAKNKIDEVVSLDLQINGKRLSADLTKHRVQTPIFRMSLPEDNILDVPPGQHRLISDGYWIFFKSLEQITEIGSLGSCSSGITKIGTRYLLNNRV